MKILNLYAGIGGNRKLWPDEDTTAVEINPEIAKIYQDFFPNDKVIVGDAHEYLLKHFKEFDFIWSSPPCPSHSRFNFLHNAEGKGIKVTYKYPDMKLYEEIIFLSQWFKGKWVVENVISYYKPLIQPQEIASHYYWSNFYIKPLPVINRGIRGQNKQYREDLIGFNLDNHKITKTLKQKIINNCVEPETGLHIYNQSKKNTIQLKIF